MPLLSKQLVEIIGTTRVRFAPGGKRRGAGRIPVRLPARAQRFAAKPLGPAVSVVVTDLSIDGVRMLYPQALAPGEEFIVCFTPANSPPVHLRYLTRRCAPLSNGHFLIGGELVGVFSGDVGSPAAISVVQS